MDILEFYSYFDIKTILVLILTIYFIYRIQNSRNLPPGPWGLPIFGYIPLSGRDLPFNVATNLSRTYGNVFSLQTGSRIVIFLNDYQSIKEGFADSNACSFRPPREIFNYLIPKQCKHVTLAEGERARQHRRFILTILKELGMGKQCLEPKILDEVKHLLEAIKSLNDEPVNLYELLVTSTANVIWLLEYGYRFEYNDETFQKILTGVDKFSRPKVFLSPHFFMPWIKYVPFISLLTGFNSIKNLIISIHQIFYEFLRQRKLTHVTGDKSNYVNAYLTERANQIEKNGNEGFFDIEELVGNMELLFGAGTETTASTILWGILYLIKYPQTYEKIEHEIQDVIGVDREPSLADKSKMPYTQAFLMETMRRRPALPLSLFHSNAEKTTIAGQPIPKRSLILGNIWAVHHDPKLWTEPEMFRPERFIDEKGQIKKSEYLIPFSIGKRSCVGESLAQMELFLTFTSLCQRFRFDTENGTPPCFDGGVGLVYKPNPQKIRAIAK